MLTEEEFVEATALRRRGWSISAIARHLGRDRKTIRAYLAGERAPGVRRRAVPDHFAPFEPYVRERLREDPHLWGSTLYDEVSALGYPRSYVTFVREIRRRRLRPRCEACTGVKRRPTIEIAHPPRRGDPVGLAQAPGRALGRRGAPARGDALPLGSLPGGLLRGRGPGAPGGRDRRGPAASGRDGAALAARPDGDRLRSRHGQTPSELRRRRPLLRRLGRCLPSTAGESQGCSRVAQPLPHPALLADARGSDAAGGPSEARPLPARDRRPATSPPAERRRARRHGAAAGAAGAPLPGHARGRANRLRRLPGLIRGQPLLGPARPTRAARHRLPQGGERADRARLRRRSSPATGSPQPGRARSAVTRSTASRSSRSCCRA